MNKKTYIIIGIIIKLLVTIIIIYFYKNSSSELALLEPEYTVFKDKPKDPGGIDIPNSDSLIYEQLKLRSNKTTVGEVNVLPDPELPLEIGFKNSLEEKIVNSIDQILENLELYESDFLAESENESKAATDIVMPDDIKLGNKNFADQQNNAETIPTNFEIDEATSLKIIKANSEFHKFSEVTSGSPDSQNGFKIQLAMARTEADAQKSWQSIKKRHEKILQDSHLIIKKVESKNERIFYLVMAGLYASPYKAKLVCSNLKSHNQNCIVTE